jgi:hypothetical protein
MKVAVGLAGCVIVDHNVHALDIDTTSKDVCCNKDSLFEVFERLITVDAVLRMSKSFRSRTAGHSPLFLGEPRVDANTREVAVVEQLVQFVRAGHRFDKDNDLIER